MWWDWQDFAYDRAVIIIRDSESNVLNFQMWPTKPWQSNIFIHCCIIMASISPPECPFVLKWATHPRWHSYHAYAGPSIKINKSKCIEMWKFGVMWKWMSAHKHRTPKYRWQGLMKTFKILALMYKQNFKKSLEKCLDCSSHESQKWKYVQIIIRPSF